MAKTYSVSVVIPNYNGAHLLTEYLPKLMTAYANKSNYIKDIIVVDNGSDDKSLKLLANNFPEIKTIKLQKNYGFAKAVNMGVRYATGSLVLLLNNDVVVNRDFLVHALAHFDDSQVFAVSLHEIGYGPATANFAGGYLQHASAGESMDTQLTFWVSGGSGLFRKSHLKRLKGLDEKLFSPYYWEDLDICYRAAKRGLKLLWEGRAQVKHEHESTAKLLNQKETAKIRESNELKFVWKNITSKRLFRKHLKFLVGRTLAHPGYIKIILRTLRSIGDIKRARTKEKKETKVSDEAIFARFS